MRNEGNGWACIFSHLSGARVLRLRVDRGSASVHFLLIGCGLAGGGQCKRLDAHRTAVPAAGSAPCAQGRRERWEMGRKWRDEPFEVSQAGVFRSFERALIRRARTVRELAVFFRGALGMSRHRTSDLAGQLSIFRDEVSAKFAEFDGKLAARSDAQVVLNEVAALRNEVAALREAHQTSHTSPPPPPQKRKRDAEDKEAHEFMVRYAACRCAE